MAFMYATLRSGGPGQAFSKGTRVCHRRLNDVQAQLQPRPVYFGFQPLFVMAVISWLWGCDGGW